MEIRDRITEEATKQFFKLGIRNVTMDEIAVTIGISKRTLYETFKDKSELVQTCIKKLGEAQDRKKVEVISNSSNVIESIFVFMREGIKAINYINPVFFKDLKKLYPSLWNCMEKEGAEKNYNLSFKLLSKGVEQGLFRKDLNISIVAKLFHAQMTLLANETVFPRDEYDHSEVFQNMIINFTRGISTRKGIDVIEKIED